MSASRSTDIRQHAASWFVRMQRTPEHHPDRTAFAAWLAADPRHASEYRAFSELWDDLQSTQQTQALAGALHKRTTRRRLLGGSVAGVLLLAGGGLLLRQALHPALLDLDLSTGPGEQLARQLPDGSHLQLGGRTQVGIAFDRNQRHLRMQQGQAIFTVARDHRRPFTVDTPGGRIEVLGTRFALDLLPDKLRLSVHHGQVRATSRTGRQRIALVGDVLDLRMDGHIVASAGTGSDHFAFAHGRLVFRQAGLAEIAHVLSRYHAQPVTAAPAPDILRIDAVLQIDDIPGFLQALPGIAPVDVHNGPGGIELRPRTP